MLQVLVNRGDQGGDAVEGAASNPIAGNFPEPALDEVEPAAAGGNEMKVDARMATQPALHRRTRVGAQIVENHMDGLVGWRGLGLDRTRSVLPLRPRLPERQTHDYIRHGTTCLYAAWRLLDGVVFGTCRPKRDTKNFVRFLDRIDRPAPCCEYSSASGPAASW
jgi:hypothetical protein